MSAATRDGSTIAIGSAPTACGCALISDNEAESYRLKDVKARAVVRSE